jgi:predicted enzyme related to lactoylglutathione lyase
MTTDTAAAETFYKNVIGWTAAEFKGAPMPYTTFMRGDGTGVAGMLPRPDDMAHPPFWAMYIAAPDLEAVVAQIKRLGGREHTPVIEVPEVGRMQMMADPQGAAFYVIAPTSEERPEGTPEIGEGSWHELMTTDMTGAMQFYREVFGWEPSEAMDMGEGLGMYQMFNRPHGMIGGMMNKPKELADVPPHWAVYFLVPDINAAVEKVTSSGGKILNGPMEVPGGDWVVNAMDPQGAAFSLHARARST